MKKGIVDDLEKLDGKVFSLNKRKINDMEIP